MRSSVFSLRSLCALALGAMLTPAVFSQTGPTFGDVVSLGYTPSDLVLDESRSKVYVVNPNANRVEIYDYESNRLSGSITVGTYPISAAISSDSSLLYVTNRDSSS